MNQEAMTPHGLALLAYADGDTAAELEVLRSDGVASPLPVGHFFRDESQLSAIDSAALERCRGHVLDVGAGTGVHSLILQSKGLSVTAIDVSPEAVQVMVRRGVRDARVANVFEYGDRAYDTVLLLGHGIGIVEDLEGLRRFLQHAQSLVPDDGQILFDSMDVTRSPRPDDVAYLEENRRAGRYVGEIRMRLAFRGSQGPFFGWLHVDPPTLAEETRRAGWVSEIVLEHDNGEYLARLTRS